MVRFLLVFVALVALSGPSLAQNNVGGKQFCSKYAENVSRIAKNAIAQNSSCFDPDKGMHGDYQSHYNWCMRTPRASVKGAAKNIRRLARQCRAQASGNRPGGDRFCQQYASSAADVSKQAIARNPACLMPDKGVHSYYKGHYDWCMKTPRATVEGAAKNIRRLARACSR